MQVSFSQRERGVVVAVLGHGETWGGSEAALLARDDLYTALRLSEFEGAKHVVDKLSETQKRYELSREAGEHLIASVCNSNIGLSNAFGRILAPVVRRMRAALDASKPKEKPGGAAA